MQREPWTYSLIEMHRVAKEIIDRLKESEEYSEYGFCVDHVCRCIFDDGKLHYLIWVSAEIGEQNADGVDVAVWLADEMEEADFDSDVFSIMLNGVEVV